MMDIVKIQVEAQKDELKKGHYKIVVLHERQVVIIPARGVPKNKIVDLIDPIRYAFEHGFILANEIISLKLSHTRVDVTRGHSETE